ncbi:MAG: ABC transporter ATP-binding protein [Geminicoccaceae bacterium]
MSPAAARASEPLRNDDPQSPVVVLQGVHKAFKNGTVALENLDLAIGRHEFVSLLGPSGCGKSTALRLIAGLGQPSRGRIAWPEPLAVGDIGFVFQEPTLMPWATVFDNVWLPLRLKGQGRAAVRPEIEAALALVGLDGFANAYPRELSGGMRMRVSIARAIVTKPRLLLMDEPFAALDEITRFKLNNDLLHLWQRESWTVVFVTHSVYESVYLSQRIVVMAARPGRGVADLAVDAPYPRDEEFRTSEPYNAACREVSAVLHRAMGS